MKEKVGYWCLWPLLFEIIFMLPEHFGMSQTAMDFGEQWGSHKARLSSWCTSIASIQDPIVTSSLLNILRLKPKNQQWDLHIKIYKLSTSKAFQTCHSELLQLKPLSRLKERISVHKHVGNIHFQSNCLVSRTWQIIYLSPKPILCTNLQSRMLRRLFNTILV